MISEVQYGGKITDAKDSQIFEGFSKLWVQDDIFNPSFSFSHTENEFNYQIP